jgi:hypothetical protein
LNDEPDWHEVVAYARARTIDELTLDRLEEPDEQLEPIAERDAVC